MKKILFFSLFSTLFVGSALLAMCPSCRPITTNYISGTYTPAAIPAPVVVESAAVVKSTQSRIVTVNSEEHFRTLISSGNVIVKFGTSWCKPCERLTAELEKVAEKYSEVKVVYVDTDAQPNLKSQNNISSLPTMHFYKNGIQVNAPVTSYKTEAEIKNMIRSNFGL